MRDDDNLPNIIINNDPEYCKAGFSSEEWTQQYFQQ